MALASRAVHFPAFAPIDEATRPELLELGQALLLAENVRPTERGAVITRRGFGSMTLDRYGATTRSAGHKLFSSGNAPCVIDGTQCDVYDSEADAWKSAGRVPEVDYRTTPLPAAGMALQATEMAYANGYVAVVYVGQVGTNGLTYSQYVYAALVNVATGVVVRAPEQLGSAATVPASKLANVAAYGDRYLVAFDSEVSGGGFGGSITAYYLDTSTAATIQTGWVSIGSIGTFADNTGGEPVVESMTDRVAIAYGNTLGGTDRLTVKTLTIAGVAETRNVNTSSVDPSTVAIGGSIADTLWVAWSETTSCKVIGIDADSLASDLATTATIITTATTPEALFLAPNTTTAGKGRLYAADSSNATSYMRGFQDSGAAAATDGSQITFRGTFMSGRPRMYGGRYYAHFRTSTTGAHAENTTQGNCVLCDWSEDYSWVRPVANVAPGLVTADTVFGVLAGAGLDATTGTKLYTAINVKKSGAALAPSLIAYDFAATTRWHAVAHNGTTILGGGLLAQVVGGRVSEIGFLSRPSKPTTSLSGTGFTSTNCRYVAVYEEIDGAGNWCVSGISDPSATVSPANQTVTVSTTPLTMSARLATTDQVTGTRVVFYRTPSGGSPPYYRAGVSDNTTTAAVTFEDSMADATLITQPKLYAPNLPSSVGEKLNRLAPSGLQWPVSCNGVLVGSRGSVLYHSGQPVDGEETWFSPIFQTPLDGDGDITGIGAQDGVVYPFKRRSVFAVPVEPPADNGSAGGFGAPRRLAVDVGCIDGRSIVVTALGVFFQSERGIELLTRAQSVEWVGEKVQDTVAAYPVCTAATLDPVASVVYFEMAASESSGLVSGSGRTLVFDLTLRAWVSTDRRPSYSGTADTPAQSACIAWDGSEYRYTWLETGGRVRPETGNYYDSGAANAFIVPRLEYPAFKLGLQQRSRVWRGVWLVERLSAAGFKVEHMYDWSTSYSAADDKTWTESQTSGKRQLHWTMKSGERQAVRFRVSATAPVTLGTGRGFALVGFSLDVAPKQGSSKGTPNLDPSARQ